MMMRNLLIGISLLLCSSFSAFAQAPNVTQVTPNLLLPNFTTVNGQPCALGGTCTVAAPLTVGTTTIASGTSGSLLYDGSGVLANVATTCSALSSCKIASCYNTLAAAQTALTAGGVVTVCPGSYSGSLAMPVNGAAWLFTYGVTINSSSSDCVDNLNTARQSGVGGGVYGLTCSGTATYGIKNTYANAGFTLKDLFIKGYTNGIYYQNSFYTYNDDIVLIAPTGSGILLDVCTDANCQGTGYFHHITILCSMEAGTGAFTYCPAGTMGHGVRISSDGGSLWTDIEIWGATGPAFLIYPPSGSNAFNQWITNVVADTSANNGSCSSSLTCGDGIRIDATAGGGIKTVFCDNCWGAFNANTGFVVSGNNVTPGGGSYVYDVRANGAQFTYNGVNGANINGVFGTRIENSTIANNSFNAGTASNIPPQGTCDANAGLVLAGSQITQDVLIVGNFIGNFGGATCYTGGTPVLAQKDSIDGTLGAGNLNFSIITNNTLHNVGSGGAEINFAPNATNLQANNL